MLAGHIDLPINDPDFEWTNSSSSSSSTSYPCIWRSNVDDQYIEIHESEKKGFGLRSKRRLIKGTLLQDDIPLVIVINSQRGDYEAVGISNQNDSKSSLSSSTSIEFNTGSSPTMVTRNIYSNSITPTADSTAATASTDTAATAAAAVVVAGGTEELLILFVVNFVSYDVLLK